MNYPTIYNLDMQRVAYLDNLINMSYGQKFNGLWTGAFTLAADDEKNNYCLPLYYVEIWENATRIGLFRILPKTTMRDNSGETITYHLEHVIATLMDSVMFRYHEIGGVGTYTDEVVDYILGYQNVKHWRKGAVDFSRQFQYSWENENLLAALLSVPKPFDEDYHWTYSTASYPWTINLATPDDTLTAEIRYKRNLAGIERIEDPTNLCTRLYALGQGEGINQLGIENVNPTGLAYIDSDNHATYGVVERVWVDRRFEDEESLYESAKGLLEKLKVPRIDIKVNAIDIHKITHFPLDKFILGRQVNIIDEDLGVDYTARVVGLSKNNMFGEPWNMEIEIANQIQDITGTVADLANRTRINEIYAQGATNIDSHQIADNCDASNPVSIKFHIPTEAVHVNKVLLNYTTGAFRAYSKGAAAGGSSAPTSSSGGGQTSSSGGTHSHSVSATTAESTGSHSHSVSGQVTSTTGSHTHTVYGRSAYTRYALGPGSHTHMIGSTADWIGNAHEYGGHSHSVTGSTSSTTGSHSHTVSATTAVSGGAHTHTVANHTHSVTIAAHTHDIVYGIYSGPSPTAVVVRVDGNIIPDMGLNEEEVNVTSYLSVDGGGKIDRGFHEITITPDNLGRANVVVHIQQFIQSKGTDRL